MATLTRVDALSAREREIALLVAQGLSNPEIAAKLHVTPATVKTHIRAVFHKLGVENRVELAVRVSQLPGTDSQVLLWHPYPAIQPPEVKQYLAEVRMGGGIPFKRFGRWLGDSWDLYEMDLTVIRWTEV